MTKPVAKEIRTATEYWQYVREIVAKYKGRKDNDGKRIINGN
jgi:hypothetical protein